MSWPRSSGYSPYAGWARYKDVHGSSGLPGGCIALVTRENHCQAVTCVDSACTRSWFLNERSLCSESRGRKLRILSRVIQSPSPMYGYPCRTGSNCYRYNNPEKGFGWLGLLSFCHMFHVLLCRRKEYWFESTNLYIIQFGGVCEASLWGLPFAS